MCRTAPRSRVSVDKYYAEARISDGLRDVMYQMYEGCKDLFPLVPDIGGAYTSWLRKASEGGDVLAKSREALTNREGINESDLRTLVRDALRTGEPEGIDDVLSFLANVPSPLGDNSTTYEAWLLLHCEIAASELTRSCDLKQEQERIYWKYNLPQNSAIRSLNQKLRDAWLAKRWDEMEF